VQIEGSGFELMQAGDDNLERAAFMDVHVSFRFSLTVAGCLVNYG
jgi:hypothetical protein